MSELVLAEDVFIVPRARGGNPHAFDMRKIYKAEARMCELSGVTREKAGELLYTFIEAGDEARRYLATLHAEFSRCKQRLREIEAVIVLDKAADRLKQKGLTSTRSPAGSEDLRKAVVNQDPDYQQAADVLAQVEAAAEEMDSKVEKLRDAKFCVGELIKTPTFHQHLSGGVGSDEPGAYSNAERVQRFIDEHTNVNREDYENTGFGPPKL